MEFSVAIASMFLAVACAVGVYVAGKKWLGLPVLLNLPGSVCAFLMAIGLTGWVNTMFGVFDNRIGPPAPEIPWYAWLVYAAITVAWYALMGLLMKLWRQASSRQQEDGVCRTN